MNLSGEAVRQLIDFYKISQEELIIIYDDISLEVGKIRIRDKGSAGGHNGIKSIINNINTEVFARIKIGVGQPKGDLVKHVLGKISNEDKVILSEILDITVSAIEIIIEKDTKIAMNQFNGINLAIN